MSNPNTEHARRDRRLPPGTPKLRLQHIFIWIATSAVLLAVYNSNNLRLRTSLASERFLIMSAWQTIQAAVSGAGVAGLFMLVSGRDADEPKLRDPGHWILLFLTCSIAVSLLLTAISSLLGLPVMWYPIQLLVGFCLLGYISWHNDGIWRALFAVDAGFQLIALGTITTSLMLVYSVSTFLNVAINLAMILTAVFEGLITNTQRDRLHWLGIFITAFSIASNLFWWYAPSFGLFS